MQQKPNNVHRTRLPPFSSFSIHRQVKVKWKQRANAPQTIRVAAEYVSACRCLVHRMQAPCSKPQGLSASPASLALTDSDADRQVQAPPPPNSLRSPAASSSCRLMWWRCEDRRNFLHHNSEAKSSASLPVCVGFFNRGEE